LENGAGCSFACASTSTDYQHGVRSGTLPGSAAWVGLDPVPIYLKREPRLDAKLAAFKYQQEAVESIRDREYAAIFHEQGLGKTKIAVDILLYWLERRIADTVLLVVKKSLVANWVRELTAHSHLRPLVLTSDRRRNFFVFNAATRLILTHYEAVRAEEKRMALFLKTRAVAVILDEATKIKNPEADLAQTFHRLSRQFARRIIMTGTPVANRPYDLWSQIYFLDGGAALGRDFQSFKSDLDLSNKLARDPDARSRFESALVSLNRRIAPFSVRETKSGGVIELPDKVIKSIVTDWEPRQLDLYTQVREALSAVVTIGGEIRSDDAEETLKRLLRLVQIASNPALIDEGYREEPGKFQPLYDLVTDITRVREKCIVWTTFTDNADWLAEKLKGFGAIKLHGKLSMEQRDRAVEVFLKDPECLALVATPGAAKEGLTLTVANHVIFYDRGFSLDDYLQAQDRIHRVSQTRTCYVYNLVMKDSIDEWVELLLQAKRLAAQLAQGDISVEYYQANARYSYGEVIHEILGLKRASR
jgi:SNF2 family DNA or RNA helicase